MKLHRFNDDGIGRFSQFLDTLSADPALAVPTDLLTDAAYVIPVSPGLEIHAQQFANRMDAARCLDSVLSEVTGINVERDTGLWTWLSLFYFDQLCPPDGRGHRKPMERARWIPAIDDAQRYYRHFLAGAYRVYVAHRDDPHRAMVLLHVPFPKITHFWFQLASRQELVTNAAVMEAATELYLEQTRTGAKRGATSEKTPGSVFRFAAILNQFDPVWDLYAMEKDTILSLLPREFDRFRDHGDSGDSGDTMLNSVGESGDTVLSSGRTR
jgi:hypothetical protein